MVEVKSDGHSPLLAHDQHIDVVPAIGAEAIAREEQEETRPAKRQKLDVSPTRAELQANGSTSTAQAASDVDLVDADGKLLSKNQLKKARRKAAWEAARSDRKEKRRIKTKERKDRQRADPEAYSNWREEKRHAAALSRKSTLVPLTIMYDCNYDKLMNENERVSLGGQLTRAYSDNRKARWRGHMVVTGWGGSLRERFETILNRTHEGWKGVRFMEEGFDVVAEKAKEWMTGPAGGILGGAFNDSGSLNHVRKRQAAPDAETQLESGEKPVDVASSEIEDGASTGSGDNIHQTSAAQSLDHPTPPDNEAHRPDEGEIIYLSSDSPNTLTHLKPYSTYIIGGLVDKNRHKGACYKAACDAGIKTAKLPIGHFMQMQSRQVLATSHVGEIMLRWLEYGDWGKAFMAVIPKRKGGVLKGECGGGDEKTDVISAMEDEEEDVDEDDGGLAIDMADAVVDQITDEYVEGDDKTETGK